MCANVPVAIRAKTANDAVYCMLKYVLILVSSMMFRPAECRIFVGVCGC